MREMTSIGLTLRKCGSTCTYWVGVGFSILTDEPMQVQVRDTGMLPDPKV